MIDDDGPCALCGEMTNSLAANPGLWSLRFASPAPGGQPGRARAHHVACVNECIRKLVGASAFAVRTPADQFVVIHDVVAKPVHDEALKRTFMTAFNLGSTSDS